MTAEADLSALGALLADRSRAAILTELLGGQPLPAGELARRVGASPSGASNHLKRLLESGLVTAQPQGRARIYSLAGHDVAEALEALSRIAPPRPINGLRAADAAEALARARTCYDHLAGRLGVGLTRALVTRRVLRRHGAVYGVTRAGAEWLADELAIDVAELRRARRGFALACVDLTERRPHLAGALGTALAEAFLARGFARRVASGRALRVTDDGARWLGALGVAL
jgi:DNA-binding transcriptional ArsR family regulator